MCKASLQASNSTGYPTDPCADRNCQGVGTCHNGPCNVNDEPRGWCADCPDHEACATGYPCWKVQQVAAEAATRRDAAR